MSSSTGWLQPLSDGGRVIKTECKTRLPESVQVALAMAASARIAGSLAPTSVVASTTSFLITSQPHPRHTADPAYWCRKVRRGSTRPAVRTAASTHP